MNSEARLNRLEAGMTAKLAVAAWLHEAREYESLSAYAIDQMSRGAESP